MKLAFGIVIGIVTATATVVAQPAAAVGKSLADASLPAGTITVRVVAGDPSLPVVGVVVTLAGDGKPRTATTDASGRATFTGLTAGARVTASLPKGGALGTSDAFGVPAAGGVRVMLSTRSFQPAPALPRPRSFSGQPRVEPDDPSGSLAVRLVYDDLAAPGPAATTIALVGYTASETITVVTRATDKLGTATFTGLDRSGATAYFAMTLLKRGKVTERLTSQPITLDDLGGRRVVLSGSERTATLPAVDDLEGAAVAKGKVHVTLTGATDPGLGVTVVDAATGKPLATATTQNDQVELDVAARAGQVLYAETTSRGFRYRSRPFQAAADRGAPTTIALLPRLLPTFELTAFPEDELLAVRVQLQLGNNSWFPYRATPTGLDIPLPAGASGAIVADYVSAFATITPAGIHIARPLAPGGMTLQYGYSLRATKGTVQLALDLPHGAYKSRLAVAKEPGMAVTMPSTTVATTRATDGEYFVVDDVTVMPNRSIALTVTMPVYDKAETAVRRACRTMNLARSHPRRGKPMLDFTAPQLDGKPLTLSGLRGKPILVNFMATWDHMSREERPTFAKLAAAFPELAIVVAASDADPKVVATTIGPKPPFRVVLDIPTDAALGPITTAWGVRAVPESFLIDRKGVVRAYFVNIRDWSTPDALACVKALVR